jgi:hypothetical protein
MRRSWLDDSEGGWIAHRLTLVVSPPWRLRPKPLMTILERLEVEHMRHAGKENGNLCVSYDQLVEAGVSRKMIRAAENAGEALGLLAVKPSETLQGNIRGASEYRLTYVPEKGRRAPSDEWLDVSREKAEAIVAAFQKVAAQKRGPSYPRATRTSSPFGKLQGSTSSPFAQTPVTHGEHPSISATSRRTSTETGGAARSPKRRNKLPDARTEPSTPVLTSHKIGEQSPNGMVPLGASIDRASQPEGARRGRSSRPATC